jgi:hypothetical protein
VRKDRLNVSSDGDLRAAPPVALLSKRRNRLQPPRPPLCRPVEFAEKVCTLRLGEFRRG